MKSINEIRISGDKVTVYFTSGRTRRKTIKNLDRQKFEEFKKRLKTSNPPLQGFGTLGGIE